MQLEKIKRIQVDTIFSTDIYKDILLSVEQRKSFKYNEGLLILPTYFCRIIGIEQASEVEYYNDIFKLDQSLCKAEISYKRMDYRLDTKVSEEKIFKLNTIWKEIKADTNLRASFIARNLYGAGLIEKTRRDELDSLLKSAFEITLEAFIQCHIKNKNASIIKNFSIKMIHWFEIYALKDFHRCKFTEHNPKMLFYGNITRDEVYFMLFLSKIGYDIIYFNSLSDSHFSEANLIKSDCSKLEFNHKKPMKAFPKTEGMIQVQTAAFLAEKSAEDMLSGDSYDFARPWQFQDYHLKSIPLKTTYKELFKIWTTEARKREGFRIEENTVFIPNVFTKINGTKQNLNDYWNDVKTLVKTTMAYSILELPFSKIGAKSFDYRNLIKPDGLFDIHKVMNCADFKLSYLKLPIQKLIVEKVNEMIDKKHFKLDIDIHFKIKIMTTVLNMDIEIYKLLQRFDFPFTVPKVLIYHNSDILLSIEDYISIAFLNALGLDIIVLTPTGYSDIENMIKNTLFDVHFLEEIKFDLEMPREVIKVIGTKQKIEKNSIFSKIYTIFFK